MCARRQHRRPLGIILMAGVLLLTSLTACDLLGVVYEDEIKEVKDKAKDLENKVKAPAAALKKAPVVEKVKKEYKRPDLLVRRDPFVFEPPVNKLSTADEERELEPLEAFSVTQLRLVALVTGTAVPQAMFQVGSNGVFAKEGDRIGRNGGRITEIRNNEVEITIAGQAERAPEFGEDPERVAEESEPTTIIIRLSDTELTLPEETSEEERELLDSINNPGSQAQPVGVQVPTPGQPSAPASPEPSGQDAP